MSPRTAKAQLRLPQVKRSAPRQAAALDPVVLLCQAHGLPIPDLEYPFAESAGRKYRADYAWLTSWIDDTGTVMRGTSIWYSASGSVSMRLAFAGVLLEVQGGIWRSKGAHNTGTALLRDFEKANLAQTLGFIYLQATPQQVKTGDVLTWLKQVL